MNPQVFVSGSFDNLQAREIRFLDKASRLGPVTVLLWADHVIAARTGAAPRFPLVERAYLLGSLRYVADVRPVQTLPGEAAAPEDLPVNAGDIFAAEPAQDTGANRRQCAQLALKCCVLPPDQDGELPGAAPIASRAPGGSKRVIVSGCYDWLHSGHVRFFEEASALGELYVVLGHDANIRMLKGAGHPLFPAAERRYVVGAVRHVTQALIATGHGWIDAEPEMQQIQPDIYAVNEDGDKGGKREYCAERGIEYVVLKRTPAPGLPRRSSTDLRGF